MTLARPEPPPPLSVITQPAPPPQPTPVPPRPAPWPDPPDQPMPPLITLDGSLLPAPTDGVVRVHPAKARGQSGTASTRTPRRDSTSARGSSPVSAADCRNWPASRALVRTALRPGGGALDRFDTIDRPGPRCITLTLSDLLPICRLQPEAELATGVLVDLESRSHEGSPRRSDGFVRQKRGRPRRLAHPEATAARKHHRGSGPNGAGCAFPRRTV